MDSNNIHTAQNAELNKVRKIAEYANNHANGLAMSINALTYLVNKLRLASFLIFTILFFKTIFEVGTVDPVLGILDGMLCCCACYIFLMLCMYYEKI